MPKNEIEGAEKLIKVELGNFKEKKKIKIIEINIRKGRASKNLPDGFRWRKLVTVKIKRKKIIPKMPDKKGKITAKKTEANFI